MTSTHSTVPPCVAAALSLGRALDSARQHGAAGTVAVGSAPGRVNLIGEHTDYCGGFVLPMAIDRRCTAVVAGASTPAWSRLFAVDINQSATVDLRASDIVDRVRTHQLPWVRYIAGVLLETFIELGRGPMNLDLFVSSDVPLGGGLSSSASLEIAVSGAAQRHLKAELGPLTTARLCRRAEHSFAGVPCGIMDQFVSALGRHGHALLIDCREETSRAVRLPPEAAFLIADTGVRHSLGESQYALRAQWCRDAAAALRVRELRDASPAVVEQNRSLLSADELAAARHVCGENDRVLAVEGLFTEMEGLPAEKRGERLAEVGRLMLLSHESLRDVYRVSCVESDAIVEAAIKLPGVLGARMTGAGFGGCVVVLVEAALAAGVRAKLEAWHTGRFGRSCRPFVCQAADGAMTAAIELPGRDIH